MVKYEIELVIDERGNVVRTIERWYVGDEVVTKVHNHTLLTKLQSLFKR